jgi:oligoribonuclease NrnB/cAMP/cGMP phosphodiesterase (DHH superfamily)
MIIKDLDGIVCGLNFIGHAVNYNSVWMKEKALSHSVVVRDIENESNPGRQQLHWG